MCLGLHADASAGDAQLLHCLFFIEVNGQARPERLGGGVGSTGKWEYNMLAKREDLHGSGVFGCPLTVLAIDIDLTFVRSRVLGPQNDI